MENKAVKRLVIIGLVGLLVYFLASRSTSVLSNVSRRDSIQYWAGGRLLANHGNPYDPIKVAELERSQGYVGDRPLVIRTPPWSLSSSCRWVSSVRFGPGRSGLPHRSPPS